MYQARTAIRSRSQAFRKLSDADGLPIWEVPRATSAAPDYFPPTSMHSGNGPEIVTFKDGGFGLNNPSEEAYHDIANKQGVTSKNIGSLLVSEQVLSHGKCSQGEKETSIT